MRPKDGLDMMNKMHGNYPTIFNENSRINVYSLEFIVCNA